MSNEALKNAVAVADGSKQADFPAMLTRYKDEIARALPKHITADRMARIALTCYRSTPMLAKCEPLSVFASVIKASQLGLEPGLNGRSFLIPYKNRKTGVYECQFVPGWKGLVELANRTGRASVWTGAVFNGDSFDFQLGDSPFVRHVPAGEDDPKMLTHTYSVGRIRGAEWPIIEAWPMKKIWKHRDKYNKQGTDHYSYREPEMYARKVPLLQVLKYLPSSPELEAAIALNDRAEAGMTQGLTIDGALAPTYEPPTDDGDTGGNGGSDGNGTGDGGSSGVDASGVLAAIQSATTVDQLDIAQDLIRGVADEQARANLDVEARAKRRALTKAQ